MEACFVRFSRKNNKITQKELAVMIGCNVKTIKRWENRQSKISKKNMEKLKNILGNSNKGNKINISEM